MWWVINKSGNVIGPFSSEQLERQIKLNMIHSLDRISKDKKEWFYVKDSAFWYPARTMKTHGLSSSLPKIDHKDVDNVVVDSSIEDNAQVSETQNRGDCNTSSEHHINLNTNVIQDKRFWVALILIVVIALFGFGVITFLLVKNSTLQNEVNSIEDKGDRKEKSESSPELVGFNKIKDKLVIIECDEGFGSGFLLSMNGKTYLMTNEHVVRCTKTPNARLLDGTPLKLGSFSIATDRDLARFEVIECSVNPFQMNDILPNTGDMVAVYGNSLGRGVVTESKGFIQGVGPNRLETNCEIVPGNSGSPLVAADGRILGVAAFVDRRGSDEWTVKNTRYEGTPRRFAVRFTGVAWKNIDRTRYEQQIANLKEFETYWEYLLPYLCFDSTQVEEEQLIFNDMKSKNFKLKENAYVEMLKELTKIFEKREKVYNQFSDHLNARDIFILNSAVGCC